MSISVENSMGVIPIAPRQMPARWPGCDVLQASTTIVITLLKNPGG